MNRSSMYRDRFFIASFAALSTLGGLIAVAACSSSTAPPADDTDAFDNQDPDAADAAPATATCNTERAYAVACGQNLETLTCGNDRFNAWCSEADEAVNSVAFRRGETQCLTAANCAASARYTCQYQSYASATQTSTQMALVTAYCKQCEPTDIAGCTTRSTVYNPATDTQESTDIFTASWELGDDLTQSITTMCTGMVDGGSTASTDGGASECVQNFNSCAGGLYVTTIPDCPP